MARLGCAFGKQCKYGLEGTCRYVHSAEEEAHFTAKREVLEAERCEQCPFWRLGRCRWGDACRWRHGDASWGTIGDSEVGDSDYDVSDASDRCGSDDSCSMEGIDGDVSSKCSGFAPPRPGSWRLPSPLPLPREKVVQSTVAESQCGSVGGVEGGGEEEGTSRVAGGEGVEGEENVSCGGSEESWETVGTEGRVEAERVAMEDEDPWKEARDGGGCRNCGGG